MLCQELLIFTLALLSHIVPNLARIDQVVRCCHLVTVFKTKFHTFGLGFVLTGMLTLEKNLHSCLSIFPDQYFELSVL